MEKVILIRFGEIFLKGKNRKFFEKRLILNIKESLQKFNVSVEKIPGRYVVSGFNQDDELEIVDRLSKIAGIFSFSRAICFDSDFETMANLAKEMATGKTGTFKIETNRADKTFKFNSMQVSREIGGAVLSSNHNLKVDVKKPEFVISIDIRENGKTFMSSENIKGVGGMPVGTSGRGLLLLSGGIDSPVAGFMVAKRGVSLSAVHFHSYPYTSDFAREKVENLAKIISKYTGNLKIYMVSMTELQEQIHQHCDNSFMITLLRRGMFTVAEKLCEKYHLQMIVTGEALGQVASQTIESMTTVAEVVKHTQIIRPLVAFDKCETIEIAEKIGTYETSILPYEDCCTVFLPDNPIVRPDLEKTKKQQARIDFDAIIERAMQSVEIVEINAD